MTETVIAWLFTRNEVSVRIVVTPTPHGRYLLAVYGPGAARATYPHDDVIARIHHQTAVERDLVEQGFSLHGFTSGRRATNTAWAHRERRESGLRLCKTGSER
jgi:hypothetical protein